MQQKLHATKPPLPSPRREIPAPSSPSRIPILGARPGASPPRATLTPTKWSSISRILDVNEMSSPVPPLPVRAGSDETLVGGDGAQPPRETQIHTPPSSYRPPAREDISDVESLFSDKHDNDDIDDEDDADDIFDKSRKKMQQEDSRLKAALARERRELRRGAQAERNGTSSTRDRDGCVGGIDLGEVNMRCEEALDNLRRIVGELKDSTERTATSELLLSKTRRLANKLRQSDAQFYAKHGLHKTRARFPSLSPDRESRVNSQRHGHRERPHMLSSSILTRSVRTSLDLLSMEVKHIRDDVINMSARLERLAESVNLALQRDWENEGNATMHSPSWWGWNVFFMIVLLAVAGCIGWVVCSGEDMRTCDVGALGDVEKWGALLSVVGVMG
ncbi:hypothetical protein M427DRAFT_30349 [Gonapodya prolifera JEL478]|uniref:Uncharacterized protein n=1 Tax=Gonapodya prolifera (strain JEL478) TaxID=1344416 RepID=A0A139ALZ9_GONPJ|nr:hypothetical protein M427DRAFT_30349 [Gonapodya prolifera JEL478]|eukprot:KXS17533.1 hypothetical protein M427DRAFT_30349 [Gonapodya prolifera JEL478]